MTPQAKFSNTILVRFILSLLLLNHAPGTLAHHPHDQIDAMAISPSYSQDRTLFIANAGHLFRSTDAGYSWSELVKGLENVHPIISIATSQPDKGTFSVYISTSGDGIFLSRDAGNSWTTINGNLSNLSIQALSVRPDGSLFAIDASGQLNISHDQGLSWRAGEFPADTTITSISPSFPIGVAGNAGGHRVLAGSASGKVYLTRDNGTSWTPLGQMPTGSPISIIAFDPNSASGNHFFIGTKDNGLFKSTDNGASFQPLNKDLSEAHITALAFSPDYAEDHTLYANTWRKAVFISRDEGDTWEQFDQGLTTSKQADTIKYRSPHFREIGVISGNRKTLFLAGFDGLFKSTDQGHSWEEMETLAVSLIKSLDVSPGHKNGDYSIAIGTYGGGAYISHNQGASWTIGNKGLNTTRIGDIKFTPSYLEDDTLFAGSLNYMLNSDTKGSSWEKTRLNYTNLKKRLVLKLEKFGLPKDVGRDFLNYRDMKPVYPNSIAISPNYAVDHTVFVGTRYHGLYLLNTERMELEHVWKDASASISTISLSPYFSDDQTAFLFVRGDKLYKSTDGGYNWHSASKGLPFKKNHDSVAELFTHKNLEVIFSPHYQEDNTLYAAGPMGIFKSTDTGDSWRVIDNATLGSAPNIQALAAAPDGNDTLILLVSLKGRGLFRSVDNGASFMQIAHALIDNNQSIELIEFSQQFAQDKVIFAASDQDLFRSSDEGDNWTRIDRPVRYEDRRDAIKYTGNWASLKSDEFSASTVHYSETPGDTAKLNFSGCGVRWLAARSPQGGAVDVYIDNSLVTAVNLYAASVLPVTEVFARHNLACGSHSIRIELSSAEDDATKKGRVILDAFDVLPAGKAASHNP